MMLILYYYRYLLINLYQSNLYVSTYPYFNGFSKHFKYRVIWVASLNKIFFLKYNLLDFCFYLYLY